MATAGFSENGEYYSLITKDGRLRIWDTETNVLKQEYTPDLHLSSPPSCLQWISVSLSANDPDVERKYVDEKKRQCIALGTSNGKILIYSLSEAKVENVLIEKNNRSKVVALDWHRKYGLFSGTANHFIQEWDLQSLTVISTYNINVPSTNKQLQGNKVTAIRLVPHCQITPARFLIVASGQLRLWRLDNSIAVVVKCLGYNNVRQPLMAVTTLNESNWLVEGTRTERILSFWNVTIKEEHLAQVNGEASPSKPQKKKFDLAPFIPMPICNFLVEAVPNSINVNLTVDKETKLRIAATTIRGLVHYYELVINGESIKPIKPLVTIQVATEEAKLLPVECCRLLTDKDLLVGYTNGSALVFERITANLKIVTQSVIRDDLELINKAKQDADNKSQMVDKVTYVEPMGGASYKRATPGGIVEVNIETRLANLTAVNKSPNKAAVNQNLTKLLMQGLQSKDKGLILTVLQKDDPAVASCTVAALPADCVPPLIEQLIDLATRKTSQCSSVCTWLTAVLKSHSALLLASANTTTSDRLSQLLTIFTHRRSHLCQLLNLKGRLDLAIAQRSACGEDPEQQSILDYNDTSSDDEMEVERYQSGSEHSWESQASSRNDASDD